MRYPDHLLKLFEVLKHFPGVGNRTAERFAFHLLNWSSEQLKEFTEVIGSSKVQLKHCEECGCLSGNEGCLFCSSPERKNAILCIISSARDVFSIEETGEYKGHYHVLGALLSPIDRRGPEVLRLEKIKKRIEDLKIEEVIIALDSTLEGDATALYIKDFLAASPVRISRLAFGLPMGSSIDYVDGGTLAKAFSGRNRF